MLECHLNACFQHRGNMVLLMDPLTFRLPTRYLMLWAYRLLMAVLMLEPKRSRLISLCEARVETQISVGGGFRRFHSPCHLLRPSPPFGTRGV